MTPPPIHDLLPSKKITTPKALLLCAACGVPRAHTYRGSRVERREAADRSNHYLIPTWGHAHWYECECGEWRVWGFS